MPRLTNGAFYGVFGVSDLHLFMTPLTVCRKGGFWGINRGGQGHKHGPSICTNKKGYDESPIRSAVKSTVAGFIHQCWIVRSARGYPKRYPIIGNERVESGYTGARGEMSLKFYPLVPSVRSIRGRVECSLLDREIHSEIPCQCYDSAENCQCYHKHYQFFQSI